MLVQLHALLTGSITILIFRAGFRAGQPACGQRDAARQTAHHDRLDEQLAVCREGATQPWRGQMTIPRASTTAEVPPGLRLVQEPTEAIQALRGGHVTWRGQNVA